MVLVGYKRNLTELLDMGKFPTYSLTIEGKYHTDK